MENPAIYPVIAAAIGAAVAILGVIVNNLFTARGRSVDHKFQSAMDQRKRYLEYKVGETKSAIERIETAHKLFSALRREFSISSLDSNWHSGASRAEYDKRFQEFSDKSDELLMIAELYENAIKQNVDDVIDGMQRFWFNFTQLRMHEEKNTLTQSLQQQLLSDIHTACAKVGNAVKAGNATLLKELPKYKTPVGQE